jgi:hypothetical protein
MIIDVFVSYANKDLRVVKDIVAALEEAGIIVWWDRKITKGRNFRNEIKNAIKFANRVLVVWSNNSIGSRWVLAEVDLADKDDKLIHVSMGSVTAIDIQHFPV